MKSCYFILSILLLSICMPKVSGGPIACLSCVAPCLGIGYLTTSAYMAISACVRSGPVSMAVCVPAILLQLGICGQTCIPICLAPTP
jgi:hypothetical protein